MLPAVLRGEVPPNVSTCTAMVISRNLSWLRETRLMCIMLVVALPKAATMFTTVYTPADIFSYFGSMFDTFWGWCGQRTWVAVAAVGIAPSPRWT